MQAKYKYVNYSWDDAVAAKLDPVARLVYRSNLLGGDQRITNTGGGNTSSKIMEKDPLTGEQIEVLWVKGSGGDLRTSKRENFSSLYQHKLRGLQKIYAARADKGLKSQAEDDMVGMYTHTTFNLNPRASSIDTPLHSFITGKHVDHMHPNAVIAIAASRRCEELTQEIFNGEMAYVPWMRPGFELGLAMQEITRQQASTKAIMMGQHGFISWADDDKTCYDETLRFIERASEYIEDKYQAKGGDAKAFGGAKYQTLDEAKRHADPRADPAVAARAGQPAEAFHRHRAGRRENPALHQQPRRARAWPSWARAARTISCARRSSRSTSIGIRRPKTSPRSKRSSTAGL